MIGIKSIGWWVPSRRRSAEAMATEYGVELGAVKRAGFNSHAIPDQDDHPASMAARATKHALDAASLNIEDLDLLIYAGVSKDFPTPWVAAFGILHELGSTRTMGFDLSSRCTSGIDAIWLAKTLIESGTYSTIAIACAERFDYLMGPPRVAELITDLAYASGAATVIIRADAKNEITAFSNIINTDLSIHKAMGPIAGGTRFPLSEKPIQEGKHRWHGQLSIRQVSQIAQFAYDADIHNYTKLRDKTLSDKTLSDKTMFNEIDFVACSPLEPQAQLEVLAELGISADKTLFTVPHLGHIGSADLLLIIAIAVATKRPMGRHIVMSTRTPAYANAISLHTEHTLDAGITISGEGVDLSPWQHSETELKSAIS